MEERAILAAVTAALEASARPGQPPAFILALESRDANSAHRELRQALKVLQRRFGLRCLHATELKPPAAPQCPSQPEGEPG